MKNKKSFMLLISLAAVVILLAGCAGKQGTTATVEAQSGLEGKWLHPDMGYQKGVAAVSNFSRPVVYEFTKDGKILMDFDGKSFKDLATEQMTGLGFPEAQITAALEAAPEMTYKLDGKKIAIFTKTGSETAENSGEYKIEKDTLTLPDFGADTLILTRVK